MARENGIDIPTLCCLEGLSGWGGCRLCLVEIKGTPKLLPACVTRVAEGMEVITDSERLQKYRRMIVELLFAERNHVCSRVRLQRPLRAADDGAEAGRRRTSTCRTAIRRCTFDASHDLFRLDHNRCILCTRCVRVCDEIEGAHTWDVMGRGIDSRGDHRPEPALGRQPSLHRCGKCVHVCPTGALVAEGHGASAEMEKTRRVPAVPDA